MCRSSSWHSFWRWLVEGLIQKGCGRLPLRHGIPVSYKLTSDSESLIAGYLAESLSQHPGKSGMLPLFEGLEAMVARLALIQSAETSIDLQYYLFRYDDTGHLLVWKLLEAADRGVRVRLLLDDTTSVRNDRLLTVLASHPQISVRLYNPSAHRILRLLSFVGDFARLNHRMHNKSLTVDNRLSVVGGRNIGNEYFAHDEALEFGDLDLLLCGPVVEEVSDQFDRFWNGTTTYPVALFSTVRNAPKALAKLYRDIGRHKVLLEEHPYVKRLTRSPLLRHLVGNRLQWFFGDARVLADPPDMGLGESQQRMITTLVKAFADVNESLVIISPYFVPTASGVKLLADLIGRGVKVQVITNSLAATDVVAVHSGYKGYRETLLRLGVAIYEVKAIGHRRRRARRGSSRSSLHAKSFLLDDTDLFVGSFNFDPRSAWLNTEMGVMVRQPALNRQIRQWLPDFIQNNSYEVCLGIQGLYWRDLKTSALLTVEPQAGRWRRLKAALLALLPLESQL